MRLPEPSRRHLRRWLALGLAAAVAVPAVATAAGGRSHQPRTARQSLAAYQQRYHSAVAPGVDLDGYTSAALGRTTDSNVVTVDLGRPGVRTGVLMGRVTDTASVADLAVRRGAVAAVNGDYYAIGGSQAPQGPIVTDGHLVKGDARGQTLVGVGASGRAQEGRVLLTGTATWGRGAARPLDSYNSDLYGERLPADAVAVLDGGWGARPMTFVHPPARVGVVAVDAHHRVLRGWTAAAGQTVPPGGLLLVGTGAYASLGRLPLGSAVSYATGVATDAPEPFRWGLGSGLPLIRGGVVIHHYRDDSDPHAARTALGWKDDGRTLVMLTVERRAGSVGQGVNEIADELLALGATTAVLLDGGGSTTLVARQRGDSATYQIGDVQDGFERPVPIGVGVFVPRGSGRVLGLEPSLDAGTVFPGLHRRVGFHGYDEWYGPAAVNPTAVTLAGDTRGMLRGDGPGLVRALRPGAGHVVATTPVLAPGAGGLATGSVYLRVLRPLRALQAPDALRLSPGTATGFRVTGSDGTETAPVDPGDLDPDYDHALLDVTAQPDGSLRVTARPGSDGHAVPVVLTAAGIRRTVVVTSGYVAGPLADPGVPGAYRVTGGRGRVVPLATGGSGLEVALGGESAGTRATSVATALAAAPVALPRGTVRLGLTVVGDGRPHGVRLLLVDRAGRRHDLDLGTTTTRGGRRLEAAVPAVAGGLRLLGVAVTGVGGRNAGQVVLDGISARR